MPSAIALFIRVDGYLALGGDVDFSSNLTAFRIGKLSCGYQSYCHAYREYLMRRLLLYNESRAFRLLAAPVLPLAYPGSATEGLSCDSLD
jgi:hypothetical protein